MHTDKVQARVFRNAALGDGETVFIGDGQFHEAVIGSVTNSPDDGVDVLGFQVEFGDLFRGVAILLFWDGFLRGVDAVRFNILIDHGKDVFFGFVGFRKVFFHVGFEHDLAILRARNVTEELHAVTRELMQVEGMTTVFPAELWIADKTGFRGWEFFYRCGNEPRFKSMFSPRWQGTIH